MYLDELQKIIIKEGGSIPLNKGLVKAVGLNSAVFYGELLNRYIYFKNRNKLKKGFFYNSTAELQEATSLSKFQQKKASDILEQTGLIRCRLSKIRVKYYQIVENPEKVTQLIREAEEEYKKLHKDEEWF